MTASFTQFQSLPTGTTDTIIFDHPVDGAGSRASGTVDLSVGETAIITFDITDGTYGDNPTFDKVSNPSVGTLETTDADAGLFTYTLSFADWLAAGSPSSITLAFNNSSGLVASDAEFNLTVTCFAPGTLIATCDGEKTVETLKIGDLIRTADGRDVPVKWVGVQTVSTVFSQNVGRLQPVLISKGALGNGLPHTDLTVTADHGMVIDDLVINAGALVNGETIRVLPMAQMGETFTVYHTETESHDVILANGAPAETFIDYVGRATFDNYQEYVYLYGAETAMQEMDMPRVSSARLVPQSIRARLAGEGAQLRFG